METIRPPLGGCTPHERNKTLAKQASLTATLHVTVLQQGGRHGAMAFFTKGFHALHLKEP